MPQRRVFGHEYQINTFHQYQRVKPAKNAKFGIKHNLVRHKMTTYSEEFTCVFKQALNTAMNAIPWSKLMAIMGDDGEKLQFCMETQPYIHSILEKVVQYKDDEFKVNMEAYDTSKELQAFMLSLLDELYPVIKAKRLEKNKRDAINKMLKKEAEMLLKQSTLEGHMQKTGPPPGEKKRRPVIVDSDSDADPKPVKARIAGSGSEDDHMGPKAQKASDEKLKQQRGKEKRERRKKRKVDTENCLGAKYTLMIRELWLTMQHDDPLVRDLEGRARDLGDLISENKTFFEKWVAGKFGDEKQLAFATLEWLDRKFPLEQGVAATAAAGGSDDEYWGNDANTVFVETLTDASKARLKREQQHATSKEEEDLHVGPGNPYADFRAAYGALVADKDSGSQNAACIVVQREGESDMELPMDTDNEVRRMLSLVPAPAPVTDQPAGMD